MKNYISLLVTVLFMLTPIQAQPWQQNDVIFNPSGIPSLPFSQPRFADVDADGDFDLILGSTTDRPLYFENTGLPSNPVFQIGNDIFSSVLSLDAEMGVFHDLDNLFAFLWSPAEGHHQFNVVETHLVTSLQQPLTLKLKGGPILGIIVA